MQRITRTKILATVGPASSDKQMLEKLVHAGVNAFRLNLSHANGATYKKTIAAIQEVNKKLGTHVGIVADLQGPKIRIGEVENNGVKLISGKTVTLTTRKAVTTSSRIFVNFSKFASDVSSGDQILIDDGLMELKVISTNRKDTVKAKVIQGGLLLSRKGVNLPDTNVSLPSLTKKDLEDLKTVLSQPVNWIALSFVRTAKDILALKKIIQRAGKKTKVIAKIEKPQAVKNIDEIIDVSDAVMIARGDLGVEMPQQKVPVIQKDIISKCIAAARPVIIATQMMQSMIENPRPTRAEITDVANGIFDGADCLMLSTETASGKFPVKVIETIKDIALNIEQQPSLYDKKPVTGLHSKNTLTDAVCLSACKTAKDVDAAAIICMTRSGYTGFVISSYRPKSKVLVFMEDKTLLNTMSICWGAETFYYHNFRSTGKTIEDVKRISLKAGRVKKGDVVINTASTPHHWKGSTNMLKVSIVE